MRDTYSDADEPMPRWPNWQYAKNVLALYAALALVGGVLAFIILLAIAKPVIPLLIGLGVVMGVVGARHWRALRDFLHRLVEWQHVG